LKIYFSYPLDPYGRLWSPKGSQDYPGLIDLTTSAPSIDITGALNKPPEIVMTKAMSGDGFIMSGLNLPSTLLPVYLALYFSEPQSLGRTQKRSFTVFLDGMQVGSHPIVPVFGKATQVILRDVMASSESQLVFKSTDDSGLPTIISGLEVYSISNYKDHGSGGGGQSGSSNNGKFLLNLCKCFINNFFPGQLNKLHHTQKFTRFSQVLVNNQKVIS